MGDALPAENPAAVPAGTIVPETANPADGALNVHVVGGTANTTISGPLPAQVPASTVVSSALEASHVLKATSGTLFRCRVQIHASAPSGTYYVQIIAGTSTVPSDGALPGGASFLDDPAEVVHTNGTPDEVSFEYTPQGTAFTTGLVADISTTEFTKTAAGAYATFEAELS